MERLPNNSKPHGITATALRTWGFLMLLMGLAGRGLIQNGILGLTDMSGQELLQAMNQSGEIMVWVTVSLALTAVESCAAPIFAFLTVEGFRQTRNYKNYLLRVFLAALATEIPYNMAINGTILDFSTRNPVFGIALSLILLYFYRYCGEKTVKNTLIKLIATVAAVVWGRMLSIEYGSFLVLLVAVLWLMRSKPMYRPFVGCAAAVLGTVISPFYIASPMGFLAIHFYNGEKGEENRLVNYLAYPAMVAVIALATMFL